jgi:hypothetical protein
MFDIHSSIYLNHDRSTFLVLIIGRGLRHVIEVDYLIRRSRNDVYYFALIRGSPRGRPTPRRKSTPIVQLGSKFGGKADFGQVMRIVEVNQTIASNWPDLPLGASSKRMDVSLQMLPP